MSPESRAAERDVCARLVCTECGSEAEGNCCSWTDGSGEICDACSEADSAQQLAGATS